MQSEFSFPLDILSRNSNFFTREGQCTFQLNKIKRLLQERINIHSNQLFRNHLKIKFRNHYRNSSGDNPLEFFHQHGTVCIRKVKFHNRYTRVRFLYQLQRFTSSRTAIVGIPGPTQKCFQRAS